MKNMARVVLIYIDIVISSEFFYFLNFLLVDVWCSFSSHWIVTFFMCGVCTFPSSCIFNVCSTPFWEKLDRKEASKLQGKISSLISLL